MFKKKKENNEVFTPEDLGALAKKSSKERAKEYTLGRYSAKRDSEEIAKDSKWKKRALIALLLLIIILLILYILSLVLTQWGDLIVSIERPLGKQGVVLSETADFEDTATVLSADRVSDVTNITYDWLPADLDDIDGSHNGRNYLAYTCYIQNQGEEPVDYQVDLDITGVAKSMDEAVRVMIYKNGEPTIFAKRQYEAEDPEPDTTVFASDTKVMHGEETDFAPGETNKYTVVVWVEGNDPECVNDIMGGHMRMSMIFNIIADEETDWLSNVLV